MRDPDKYKGAFIPRKERERGKLTRDGVGGKHLGSLLGFRAAEFKSPNPYEVRDARLEALGYGIGQAAYQRYLASDRWKQLQEDAGESTRCFSCTPVLGWRMTPLQLHHLDYGNIGTDREIDDIQALCDSCHVGIHVLANEGTASLRTATDDYRRMLAAFIVTCKKRFAARNKSDSAFNHVAAREAFATYVLPDRIHTATRFLRLGNPGQSDED